MFSGKGELIAAIVGGGLGGVCAAIVLGRAGYSVHLFEQAPSFGEVGAGVALGPNAVNAMRMMGVLDEYAKVADLSAEGAIWFHFCAWNNSKKITEVRASGQNSSVHRARALESLVKIIPSKVSMHFRSHVIYAENLPPQDHTGTTTVRLHIASPDAHQHPDWPTTESTFDCTFAIGCDGVKSDIRNHIGLGDHRGGQVRYMGTYAYRGLLNRDKAVSKIGPLADEPTMWLAKEKHILAFPIEGGKVINLVGFVSDRSQPAEQRKWSGRWVKPVQKETMMKDFEGWDEKPMGLLELIDKPEQWALHELTPLEQWTAGNITLLGDSAHASLPHNGAGAGQAIEDAYVLGELLKMPECNSRNVSDVLLAYEEVRRTRASKQQVHSRESGEIYEFASPMRDDCDAIAEHLKTRYNWIWDHDLRKDVESAKARLTAKNVFRPE